MRIKKKDKVKVIAGKDKGKTGEVLKIYPRRGQLVVSGINVVKRHLKAAGGQRGGIREMEKPLSVEKVMMVCPRCQSPTRVVYRLTKAGKVRLCRKCQTEVDGG